MLNNDVKEIMYKKFDKDINFQKIICNKKEENKKKTYINIFKYSLVPSCIVLMICAIIIQNSNNNETDLLLENENKVPTVLVGEKDIYKTINNSGEACWAYDPTIPTNLIKDYPEAKYVVKAKIQSVGEGEMLPKQENFYNPFTCHTPIELQVIDNLLETNKLSGTIKTYIDGGTIKIENILNNATKQEIEYMGIYDVSKVDKEKYIKYIWTDPYYEPTIGDEYVIIIHKTNPNLYQVMCGGYGIFRVDKSEGQEKYINVITNKEWNIQ